MKIVSEHKTIDVDIKLTVADFESIIADFGARVSMVMLVIM